MNKPASKLERQIRETFACTLPLEMLPTLLLLFMLVCLRSMSFACSCEKEFWRELPSNFPLVEIKDDGKSPFIFDPQKSIEIEFGRGSGLDGLNTIKISKTGKVLLHRSRLTYQDEKISTQWEYSEFYLSAEDVSQLSDFIGKHHISRLHSAYHAAVDDGTQWIFWIKQGEHEKSIYCNNHFPEEIVSFAKFLDELLIKKGVCNLKWQRVPENNAREHEKKLWERIGEMWVEQ